MEFFNSISTGQSMKNYGFINELTMTSIGLIIFSKDQLYVRSNSIEFDSFEPQY